MYDVTKKCNTPYRYFVKELNMDVTQYIMNDIELPLWASHKTFTIEVRDVRSKNQIEHEDLL